MVTRNKVNVTFRRNNCTFKLLTHGTVQKFSKCSYCHNEESNSEYGTNDGNWKFVWSCGN